MNKENIKENENKIMKVIAQNSRLLKLLKKKAKRLCRTSLNSDFKTYFLNVTIKYQILLYFA